MNAFEQVRPRQVCVVKAKEEPMTR
jgi:hypothetical protein